MKNKSKAVLCGLAAVAILFFSSCSSETKPATTTMPDLSKLTTQLYFAGSDTVIPITTCDMVTRDYTTCAGDPSSYYTYLPGEKPAAHITKQGNPVTKEQLQFMLSEAGIQTVVSGEPVVDSDNSANGGGTSYYPTPIVEDAGWGNYIWNRALSWSGWPWILGLLLLLLLLGLGTVLVGLLRRAIIWAGGPVYQNNNGKRNETTGTTSTTTSTTNTTVTSGAGNILAPAPGLKYREYTVTVKEDYVGKVGDKQA